MNRLEELGGLARSLGCEVRYQEPMSRHTTFRIGGPADLFVAAEDKDSLGAFCRKASELEIPVFPLGNGSNLLVSDQGIRGAVVTSGAPLASVCGFARNHSLTGLEFVWGIPGTAGGAVFMNAGAYNHSVSDVVSACRHIAPGGKPGSFEGKELGFGYRRSAYSGGGYCICGVRFRLCPGDREKISERMEELFRRRREKQPLEFPSAGSVFKRPEGHFAGALIEQCGLKGLRVGGAAVSRKHAGFIINLGGATCDDVRKLIAEIQETVFRRTGVALECEVQIVS